MLFLIVEFFVIKFSRELLKCRTSQIMLGIKNSKSNTDLFGVVIKICNRMLKFYDLLNVNRIKESFIN